MNDPWILAAIVLVSQIAFLYLRTVNVIFIAEKKMWPAVTSGFGVAMTWLIGVSIGVNAINDWMWQPVVGHLIGGAVGTVWAFKGKHGNKKV
jgi:uncharacterized protein YebE (UPF0316 family)